MTEAEQSSTVPDGRAARRERNISAVLDVVVGMFAEGDLFPSIEQVSKRSGLSLRSIYRYFGDPADLYEAALERHRAQSLPLAHLSAIGQGPLATRIDDFVAMRLRLYEEIHAGYRAMVHNASHQPRLRDRLAKNRNEQRLQFERHFAPELDRRKGTDRDAVLSAGDLLSQLDAIELLRQHRTLTVDETADALRAGLLALLGP